VPDQGHQNETDACRRRGEGVKNIAVFASGNGTNLQAIIDNIRKGVLPARLALVVSDRADAFALKRAEKARVKALYIDPKSFGSREDYEKHVVGVLKKEKVDLVVLAGFMRILGGYFIKSYRNRILNIHPALLPAFKGGEAIKDAFSYGVRVTGVTVHFVDEKVDHGPIIAQEEVAVRDGESVERLEERIHRLEHKIYTDAIKRVLAGRIVLKGRRVVLPARPSR
jgi:phosphoribosylglycinamide formyltransferase 1